ncbi:GNAT family N-acetyltransferase, partial [Streptomyces sp. NPDC005970]|uniref:GNAT family N-acetyltransferase n=1 Tax=Streptomyces sp. NPDC005970 TaxID=3156723 RepID=UPI0033FD777A
LARPGEGEFRMLAVRPEARRRGAAEALVRACPMPEALSEAVAAAEAAEDEAMRTNTDTAWLCRHLPAE